MTETSDGKESAQRALETLLSIKKGACTISVSLASCISKDEVPRYERLQLSDDLTDLFAEVAFKKFAELRRANNNGDLQLYSHDPGSKPDSNEIEFIAITDQPSVKLQLDVLRSLADVPLFEGNEAFLDGLQYYAIVLQQKNGKPVRLFRVYSPKKELSRSRLFGAIFAKGTYDRVRERMFLFDDHVDCIETEGYLLILSKENFQRAFRFFDLVRAAAKATLKAIKRDVPIAHFEEFEAACEGHLQKLVKLKNIAGRDYLRKVTIGDLKKVITEYKLPIQTIEENGKEKLLFDPKNKWALLKLLDDDYLRSIMTGEKYEATGKRRHQPSS